MKHRPATWYWRIWWWFGYHGLYQIKWSWERLSPEWRSGFKWGWSSAFFGAILARIF